MNSLNNVLNRIDDWSQPVNPNTDVAQGFLTRHVLTRTTELFCAVPTEIAAVCQNVLKAPVQAAGAILKIGVKGLTLISSSETLKNFEQKLPGFSDFLKTAARVIGYAIGTLFTATLGTFISPSLNFKLHCAVGLTVNRREESVKLALLEEDARKANEEAEKADAAKKKAEQDASELADLNEAARLQEMVNDFRKEVEEQQIPNISDLFTDETPTEQPQVVVEKEIEEDINSVAQDVFNDVDNNVDEDVTGTASEESSLSTRVWNQLSNYGSYFNPYSYSYFKEKTVDSL